MSDNATLFAAIIPPKPFRPITYNQWPPELKQELRGVPKVEVYDLAENGFLVVRNNECGICHELVKGQRNLQQHARNHMPSHMTPDNSWRCPVCMGTFAQKVGAQTHINSMHTHETRWVCRHSRCKFVCLDRATLNRHESRCQHRPSAVMEPAGIVKKKAEPKCRALQVQPPVKPGRLEAPSVGSKPCPLEGPSVNLKSHPLELPKLAPEHRPLEPPGPSVELQQCAFELPPIQLPSVEVKPPLGLPPMQLPLVKAPSNEQEPAKSPSIEQPAVKPPLIDLSAPSLFPKSGSSRSLLNPKSPSPPPTAQRTEPTATPVELPAKSAEPPARPTQPFVQPVQPPAGPAQHPTHPAQPPVGPAQPLAQFMQPPAQHARPPVTPPPVIWNVGPPALPIQAPAPPSAQPTAPPQLPLHPPRPSARHSRPSLSIPRELLNRSRLPREPPEFFSFKTDDDPVFTSLRGPQPWRVPRPSAPSLLKPFSFWYDGLAQASAPVKSEPPKAPANPPPTVRNDLTFVNISFHNLPPATAITPVKSEPSNNPPLPDTKPSVPSDDTSEQGPPLGFDKPEERLSEELLPPGSLIPPKATLACNDDNTVDLGDGTKLAFVNGMCTYPDCGLQFGRIKRNWTRHAMVHMKYENTKDLSWRCGADGCGKLYSSKNGAREHFLSIHTNARPYTCQICQHTFKRIDAVRKHMRGIHGQIKRKTQQLYRPSSMAGARARAANNAISAGLRKTSSCASSSDRGSSVDSSVDDASSGGPSRKSSVASRASSAESHSAPVASRRGSSTPRLSAPEVDAPQCPSPSHPRPIDDAMATDDEGTVQGEEPPPKFHWREMPSSSLRPVKLEPTDDDLVSVVEFDVDSGGESDIPIEIEYDDESMDMD